MVYRE
jgi:hypothetical protein